MLLRYVILITLRFYPEALLSGTSKQELIRCIKEIIRLFAG